MVIDERIQKFMDDSVQAFGNLNFPLNAIIANLDGDKQLVLKYIDILQQKLYKAFSLMKKINIWITDDGIKFMKDNPHGKSTSWDIVKEEINKNSIYNLRNP